MSAIAAALRISWDALAFRIRKRELNNLPVTISLMVAFALPWADVLYRSLFALVLNVFVYLLNDFCDIEVDLASAQKDQPKTRFLAEHRGAGLGALVGLATLLLVGGALHSALLSAAFCFNATVILLYSAWLKRKPVFDILMMVLWGAGMAAIGAPGTALGWKLIGLLALLCASYEAIQIVRDEPDDRAAGVRSTAVLLGAARVAWIYRAIVLGAAAYGVLVVGSALALVFALGALLPLDARRANRTWDLARALFGTAWLALLAQVYLGYLPS